jgi:hypothetical protein
MHSSSSIIGDTLDIRDSSGRWRAARLCQMTPSPSSSSILVQWLSPPYDQCWITCSDTTRIFAPLGTFSDPKHPQSGMTIIDPRYVTGSLVRVIDPDSRIWVQATVLFVDETQVLVQFQEKPVRFWYSTRSDEIVWIQ